MKRYIIKPKSANAASTTITGSKLCKTIANDCFCTLLPHSAACIAILQTFNIIVLRMLHVSIKNAVKSILSVSERIAVKKVTRHEYIRKDKLRAC